MTSSGFVGIALIGGLATGVEQSAATRYVGCLVGVYHWHAADRHRHRAAARRPARFGRGLLTCSNPCRQPPIEEAYVLMPGPTQGPPGASGLRTGCIVIDDDGRVSVQSPAAQNLLQRYYDETQGHATNVLEVAP